MTQLIDSGLKAKGCHNLNTEKKITFIYTCRNRQNYTMAVLKSTQYWKFMDNVGECLNTEKASIK